VNGGWVLRDIIEEKGTWRHSERHEKGMQEIISLLLKVPSQRPLGLLAEAMHTNGFLFLYT
jgi:hypothetical protein